MKKIIWKVIKIAGIAYLGFNKFAYEKCERLIRMLDGYCVGINDETYSSRIGKMNFRDGASTVAALIVRLSKFNWNVEKTFNSIVEEYTYSV